jgi:hypothetical protein
MTIYFGSVAVSRKSTVTLSKDYQYYKKVWSNEVLNGCYKIPVVFKTKE